MHAPCGFGNLWQREQDSNLSRFAGVSAAEARTIPRIRKLLIFQLPGIKEIKKR
jgi:hypothetical protein